MFNHPLKPTPDNYMTEDELIKFVELLEKFITHCDMPEMEAMRKAQELLKIINS